MQPIGLTLKCGKVNRYARENSGEIMLVHYCLTCGKISCNRIAGDDNAYAILKLLNTVGDNEPSINQALNAQNIRLLTMDDEDMLTRALFGNAYMKFVE